MNPISDKSFLIIFVLLPLLNENHRQSTTQTHPDSAINCADVGRQFHSRFHRLKNFTSLSVVCSPIRTFSPALGTFSPQAKSSLEAYRSLWLI